MAYETGRRIVDMAYEDLRPSAILTRASFLNAIRLLTAIGGSSNAQPHIMAMAPHAGVDLAPRHLTVHGYHLPLLDYVYPEGPTLVDSFPRAAERTRDDKAKSRSDIQASGWSA